MFLKYSGLKYFYHWDTAGCFDLNYPASCFAAFSFLFFSVHMYFSVFFTFWQLCKKMELGMFSCLKNVIVLIMLVGDQSNVELLVLNDAWKHIRIQKSWLYSVFAISYIFWNKALFKYLMINISIEHFEINFVILHTVSKQKEFYKAWLQDSWAVTNSLRIFRERHCFSETTLLCFLLGSWAIP